MLPNQLSDSSLMIPSVATASNGGNVGGDAGRGDDDDDDDNDDDDDDDCFPPRWKPCRACDAAPSTLILPLPRTSDRASGSPLRFFIVPRA